MPVFEFAAKQQVYVCARCDEQFLDFIDVAPYSWAAIGTAAFCGAIIGIERQLRSCSPSALPPTKTTLPSTASASSAFDMSRGSIMGPRISNLEPCATPVLRKLSGDFDFQSLSTTTGSGKRDAGQQHRQLSGIHDQMLVSAREHHG